MELLCKLVASQLREGRLWGLISCHHCTPRVVSAERREIASAMARDLSLQIALAEETHSQRSEAFLKDVLDSLTAHVAVLDGEGVITAVNLQDAFKYQDLTAETLEQAVTDGTVLIKKMSSTITDFRNFFSPDKEPGQRVCAGAPQPPDQRQGRHGSAAHPGNHRHRTSSRGRIKAQNTDNGAEFTILSPLAKA
jgi:hypothetical protein